MKSSLPGGGGVRVRVRGGGGVLNSKMQKRPGLNQECWSHKGFSEPGCSKPD